MGPAEVAKHATDAAADAIPGLAPWVTQVIGAVVFVGVTAVGIWGYVKPTWKKALHDLTADSGTPSNGVKTELASASIALPLDLPKLQLIPDTMQRIEAHIEYGNKKIEDLLDAQNRTTEAIDRQAQATDRYERAVDRNTQCVERLIRTMEDSIRLRERQGG